MSQQFRNSLHDRQAQTQAPLGPFAALAQSPELFENNLLILGRDTDTRVHNLYHYIEATTTAADQDAPGRRVAPGVADEILQNAPEQGRIRVYEQGGLRESQVQALFRKTARKLCLDCRKSIS